MNLSVFPLSACCNLLKYVFSHLRNSRSSDQVLLLIAKLYLQPLLRIKQNQTGLLCVIDIRFKTILNANVKLENISQSKKPSGKFQMYPLIVD